MSITAVLQGFLLSLGFQSNYLFSILNKTPQEESIKINIGLPHSDEIY